MTSSTTSGLWPRVVQISQGTGQIGLGMRVYYWKSVCVWSQTRLSGWNSRRLGRRTTEGWGGGKSKSSTGCISELQQRPTTRPMSLISSGMHLYLVVCKVTYLVYFKVGATDSQCIYCAGSCIPSCSLRTGECRLTRAPLKGMLLGSGGGPFVLGRTSTCTALNAS
jgi:hypothetical protein